MAEDWRIATSLGSFLEETERRIGSAELTGIDRDLLERWLRWAESVARVRDPFSRPLIEIPEATHPGILEAERLARNERTTEDQRSAEES